MRKSVCSAVLGTWAALACGEARTERGATAFDASAAALESGQPTARCYRSPHSVLLGPVIRKSRQNGNAPGWIRVEGPASADSGAVELVDAQGAGLLGFWRRASADSVSMAAADDFLRVELDLQLGDSTVSGPALAKSDADVELDSAGRHSDFRREWILRAGTAPCDSMPRRVRA